ncbi:unnamed protein product [Symbiodinium sp. KB8]|nr:unnamed protein product [Symbiodinium sp. KB8]
MQFGLPDIAPGEQLRGISNMIKNIEKKYPAFSMRINLLKLFPETSSRPTSDGIEKYLTTIEAQITELSADESCRSFKQDFGNASVVSTAAADKDTRKCYFHAKPGGCKRDNCPFKHEGPSGGDAGKGKGKGGKDGKDAGKGAKGGKEGKGGKGGKGKDSHAKAANATPNPNPKANPKASPKADPKANPKASAKQLLGVDKNQQSEAAPSAKASSVRIFRAQVDPVAAFPCEHKDFMRSCIDDAHVIKDRLTSGGDDQSVVVAKATTHLPKGSVGPPDRVLLDSGANELCRPLTADIDVEDTTKYMPLGVTLASGQTTQGYRTRKDGEILMPMGSTEWICGLAKLAQAGFRFTWDWEGPSLETRCGRSIPIYLDNGLPFVSWENFREIRSAISKDHRARVNKAVVAGSEEKPREEETSNPVILEEGEHMQIEGNGHEDRDQTAIAKEGFQGHEALQSTEDLATKLLEKDRLTPDDVLKLLQAAPLKRRLRRRRCEGLDKFPLPVECSGDHVLIKREKPEAFGDRTIPAIYLSQDDSTPGGAWVMHQDADKPVITRARLPLLDDKPRARWKRTITPGGESVWTSTVGEVVFADLPPDDRDGDANILTLEERLEGPPDAERNLQGALLMKSLYVGTQRELSEEDQVGEFVRFAHGFLPNMMDAADDDDGSRHPADMPAEEPSEPFPTSHDRDSEEVVVIDSVQANVTQVTSEVPDGSKGDKYYVLTAKQEEQILECEAELLEASHEQATAEPVSTSVLFQENEKERSKWISGLENELRNMDEKQVYTKVKRKDIRKTLGLEDHEDLPQVLPAKLVMTRKPNSTGDSSCKDGARAAADQAKDDWLAKVRMVVCGNYEDGTNLAIESLRALFSRAAREATWLAGALDISCAFLNAWLQERHKVLVKPPAAAVKTGHFHEDELLWLHRALYGLRRSPKEWQHERDTVLQDAVLRARAGDMFGDVTVKGLGEPGVFGLYDSEENLCGVLALYVDDCLILAPKELFTRTVSFITATWKSKVQGILARGDLKSGMEVDGVRVVDELTFLGLQLRMSDEGIHITQQRWIAQELKKRGFLHLSGCDSLPEPREGKLPSMPLGEKRDKLIKQGQMELGSLLWLTVRTRPELAAVCGVAACALTVDPGETLRLTKGVWRFIRKTWDQGLCFRWEFDSTKMENMTFSSDASLSSGASKSRSGSVIIWGNHILGWKSARQNLTAFSAQEAELEGMAQTLALGLRVSRLVERLAQRSVCKVMECDNAAALVACTKEDFYEDEVRTRHFGMRTSWIRDQAVNHHVEIRHRPGAELVSDALTKTLPRQKLHHWMSVLHGRESLPK